MLRTLFVDDFSPWEKEYLLPFASQLTQRLGGSLEVVDWGGTNRRLDAEVVWVLSRKWRKTLGRLKFPSGAGRVFVSVLHQSVGNESALLAFWQRFAPRLNARVSLISHNLMTHRYLREMEGIHEGQLLDLPLPFPDFIQFGPRNESSSGVVGTLSPLDVNANLNFIVLVAHRLLSKNPQLRFRVLGDGPLRSHLTRMAANLNLSNRFEISPVARLSDLVEWDVFLFAPLRCDHLIAPLVGIAARVPTVCAETPGLGEALGGLSVPFTPLYDTEAMAKSVEELLVSAPARSHNKLSLGEGVGDRFAMDRVELIYAREFGLTKALDETRAVA